MVNVSPHSPSRQGEWPLQPPRLHELGWIEYHLPDGAGYYAHPTRRVIADIELRQDKWINLMTDYLDSSLDGSHLPYGSEVWIRDVQMTRRGFLVTKYIVNHRDRTAVLDITLEGGGGEQSRQEDSEWILVLAMYACS
jgi:hypothetical protein